MGNEEKTDRSKKLRPGGIFLLRGEKDWLTSAAGLFIVVSVREVQGEVKGLV